MRGELRQGGGADPTVYGLNLGIPGPTGAGFLINTTDLGAWGAADWVVTGNGATVLTVNLACKYSK